MASVANRGVGRLRQHLLYASVDAREGETDLVFGEVADDLRQDRHAGEVDFGHRDRVDDEVARGGNSPCMSWTSRRKTPAFAKKRSLSKSTTSV